MAKEGMVKGMELKGPPPKDWFCDACASQTVVKEIGDLTVSDGWGPAPVTGIGGVRYYVSFTDVATRHTVLYFIKEKPEVQQHYKDYEVFIFNKHAKALRTVRFDNGTEYINAPLKTHIASKGTTIETTALHSSSQNGIAERLNLTIANWGRSMHIAAQLPKFLWPQAFAYANFIKNRTYTRALPGFLTPYERFNGSKPDGSDMWVLDQSGNNTKLDARSTLRKFVGVDMGGKAWLYWSPSQRSILASRNVKFPPRAQITAEDEETPHIPTPDNVETTLVPKPEPTTPAKVIAAPITPPTPTKPIPLPDLPLALTRTRRTLPALKYDVLHKHGTTKLPGNKTDVFGTYKSDKPDETNLSEEREQLASVIIEDATYDILLEVGPAYMDLMLAAVGGDADDRPTYAEAMKGPDLEFWREATTTEIAQLWATETFKPAKLPKGMKAIKCGWVLNKKRNADGIVVQYKGRLVAKGYSQVKGVDYELTFAPVLRLDAFHLLCALAAIQDLDIHQMDVIGAFLNGVLAEEIYMEQPPGFQDSTDRVLRLIKTLYGLKQSARVWNKRLHEALLTLGYARLYADSCVYMRSRKNKLAILAFHIDDLAVFTTEGDAAHVKGELAALFDMHDLGELQHFLGFRVTCDRSKRRLSISQDAYIKHIVKHIGLESANPQTTPISRYLITKELRPKTTNISPTSACLCTRPDICYATQYLAQFSNCYGEDHLTAVKRVFRYLKGTANHCITYDGLTANGELKEIGYVDANWGLDIINRRSVSGLVFMLAGGAVAWSSKKQATVSLSSMEAEYMGIAYGLRHALWLRTILKELGFEHKLATPIFTDSLSAIALSRDSQFHGQSKHIDIRHHFIREHVENEEVATPHIAGTENLADGLTKPLAVTEFNSSFSVIMNASFT
ncbi:hypothetical protein FRC10_011005 [Ceratobasidium sp. 414]|nr:hypothetical protein FRC10_011005 [Ceratobasidium sp. 414]